MLDLLHIEHAAVIERADVAFGPGLNVLTGETGAGKSIIIDAIGAILGNRTSRELVRSGASAALISAELTPGPAAAAWLREAELAAEPGESVVITRRITAEGKSSSRINGTPVSTAQLRALGELLFDVHGQNDGRRLLSESEHRRCLDAFGGLEAQADGYTEQYARYTALQKELAALRKSEEEKEFLEEKLKKEIRLLSAADPKDGEEETLSARANLLRGAEKLTDKLTDAYECFYGGEKGEGILSLITTAEYAVESAARIAETIGELAMNMGDFRYRAEDLGEQIESARRELDFSPGELDRIESRLSTLQRLSRRYGSAAEARARLPQAKNELEDVLYLTDRLAKLERELEAQRRTVLASGAALSEARHAAARRLESAVARELQDLSMPGSRFIVEFLPKTGVGFDSAGAEDVRFLLAANAGQAPGRLSHIVSGGELSRIMLALKNVLRSTGEAEVLIFDEIDTGVSGIAAQRVGEKLAELSEGRQVLCVTHLPQLAAMADTQFVIVKQQRDGNTYTKVTKLDESGRRAELARLIGGETVTETTLRGAGELIRAAEQYKNQKRESGI